MRHSVLDLYLSEEKVHPKLSTQKLEKWYTDLWGDLKNESFNWQPRSCPVCNNNFSETAFRRFGFKYERCIKCSTLFLSPLPNEKKLNKLIKEIKEYSKKISQEKSGKYKLNNVYKQRENWLSLNIKRINSIYKSNKKKYNIAILDDEHNDILKNFNNLYVIQRMTGGEFNKDHVLKNDFDAIVLFDVLEHSTDIQKLFINVSNSLKKGGKCFITTRCGSGMDIQICGEKSDTIFPLQHINLVSVEGLKYIANIFNFGIIELSTPGLLDLQILKKSFTKNKGENFPLFLKYIFTYRDEYLYNNFQKFLQENLLSSHLRAILEKK